MMEQQESNIKGNYTVRVCRPSSAKRFCSTFELTGFYGAQQSKNPVQWFVYTRHGRELMGWKSPIRESC